MRNIGYHTRLYSNNASKVVGGSFGGSLDMETVNRLVNSQFSVVVKHSGNLVLVDRDGREVNLYLSVDIASTDKGAQAIKDWRAKRAQEASQEEERCEREQEEIKQLLQGLSHEDIVSRLQGTA